MDGWGVQVGSGLLCRAGSSIIQQGSASRARVMAAHKAGTGPAPELEELRPVGSWFSALPKVREELQKGGLHGPVGQSAPSAPEREVGQRPGSPSRWRHPPCSDLLLSPGSSWSLVSCFLVATARRETAGG